MVDHSALQRALTDYVRTTLGRYSIGEVLYRLTDQCVEVVGCEGAGVSLAGSDETLRFVTATDQFVVPAERQQILAQEGPCFDAYRTAKPVVVADLVQERDRWPAYAEVAIAGGCRAVMGLPMDIDEASVGALDLYRHEPYDWTDEELEAAGLLADMAAGYIGNLRTLASSQRLTAQLQEALDSRVIIEQAKGALAARHDIEIAEAFQRLRKLARGRQRNIHEVARDVVEGRLEA